MEKLDLNVLGVVEMESAEIKNVNAGRTVVKQDTDGDGKWDVKMVYGDDGYLKKVKFR